MKFQGGGMGIKKENKHKTGYLQRTGVKRHQSSCRQQWALEDGGAMS